MPSRRSVRCGGISEWIPDWSREAAAGNIFRDNKATTRLRRNLKIKLSPKIPLYEVVYCSIYMFICPWTAS